MIGPRTAERVKLEIGSAMPLKKPLTLEIRGRDLLAGLPRSATITSEEIQEALAVPVTKIVRVVREVRL